MNEHEYGIRAGLGRVVSALLLMAVVLASTIGASASPATSGTRPNQVHSVAVQRTFSPAALEQPRLTGATAAELASVRPALDAEDAAELVDEVGPALVDIDICLERDRVGAGTGIVLSSGGLVLTNYHVIADVFTGATLRATELGDGHTYPATLLGADPDHDIALIQLRGASELRTAILGDSNEVEPGDQVASIGNAYGDGGRPSVGTGPVTRLNRTITSTTHTDGAPLTGLIETRSNLRPGQSGGPTVNTTGQVIGVNVASATAPDSYVIPVNTAVRVARQLLANSTN